MYNWNVQEHVLYNVLYNVSTLSTCVVVRVLQGPTDQQETMAMRR